VPCAFGRLLLFVPRPAALRLRESPSPAGPSLRLRYEGPHVLSNALPRLPLRDAKESDFRIDTLSPKSGTKTRRNGLEIMERISSGEMPPKDAKNRPSADECEGGRMACGPSEGRGSGADGRARSRVLQPSDARRVCNTVRDLLGVHFDATDPGASWKIPSGTASNGSAPC